MFLQRLLRKLIILSFAILNLALQAFALFRIGAMGTSGYMFMTMNADMPEIINLLYFIFTLILLLATLLIGVFALINLCARKNVFGMVIIVFSIILYSIYLLLGLILLIVMNGAYETYGIVGTTDAYWPLVIGILLAIGHKIVRVVFNKT